MAEPYVGEIRAFGFNFAPIGWAFCNGQLMSIAQNTALFSILGTTYGGNGQTTFALPNLQGQIPMHWGNNPRAFNTIIGEQIGETSVTLLQSEIPSHRHSIIGASVATGGGAERAPTPTDQSFLANSGPGEAAYNKSSASPDAIFSPKAISPTGGSQAHENMQPYLVLNFCISLEGIFPSRN